jgi:hypothetical protein
MEVGEVAATAARDANLLRRLLAMTEAWIIDACRTPARHRQGRARARCPTCTRSTSAPPCSRRSAERNRHQHEAEVDDIIWGTSRRSAKQGGDLGRMAALDAGYDVKASGVTIDRFCGSGITPSTSPPPPSCRAWKIWSSPAAPR